MPTNLPPEYFDAEKRYKAATTLQEKASALEELLSTIPKHKGTDKLRGDLRRKLSQLREESSKRRRSGKGDLHTVERQGAAQVALVGFPNCGKSSLLDALTNAHPVIADYPVSTVLPLAGMMQFEDIQFQMVDLPPVGNESTDGWVSGILRAADILLLVLDLSEEPGTQADLLLDQIAGWRIPIAGQDRLRDEPSLLHKKPLLIVLNKVDLPGARERSVPCGSEYIARYPLIAVSAARKEGIEDLRRAIFEHSRIIRAYSKEPRKDPDRTRPFLLRLGSTILDLAEIIHKDFVKNLKYACIWGSAKFPGQRVERDYTLHDGDVVELHVR